jgi:sarcosine oxidase subunit alpha
MTAPRVTVMVDGAPREVTAGASVAAGLLQLGVSRFRTSVSGEPRAPICGMGVCYECRVTIDGVPYQRACLVTCAAGMRIDTGIGGDG